MIEVRGLTKRYGSTLAVDRLSFTVVAGRSNAGISEALVITEGVVEKHVASIFAKLGLPATEGDNRRVLAVPRYLRPSS